MADYGFQVHSSKNPISQGRFLLVFEKKQSNYAVTTWESAMQISLLKARAEDYSCICNNLLAPALIEMLIDKYGAANWETEFQKQKLKHLPFYFGWLDNCEISAAEDKVFLKGQYGCYATFINVKGRYLLLDFGQVITSM